MPSPNNSAFLAYNFETVLALKIQYTAFYLEIKKMF